jgi:hypothetical protein
VARAHLANPHPSSHALAARLVWTIEGDQRAALTAVQAGLAQGAWAAIPAAALAVDMADAGVDVSGFVPALKRLQNTRVVRPYAARGHWRLGTAPMALWRSLVRALKANRTAATRWTPFWRCAPFGLSPHWSVSPDATAG